MSVFSPSTLRVISSKTVILFYLCFILIKHHSICSYRRYIWWLIIIVLVIITVTFGDQNMFLCSHHKYVDFWWIIFVNIFILLPLGLDLIRDNNICFYKEWDLVSYQQVQRWWTKDICLGSLQVFWWSLNVFWVFNIFLLQLLTD